MPVTACPRRVTEQGASPPTPRVFLLGMATFIGAVRSEKGLFVQREGPPRGRRLAPTPPVLKSIGVSQGRGGGGEPGDGCSGKCTWSSCTKTSHGAPGASTHAKEALGALHALGGRHEEQGVTASCPLAEQ